MTRTESSFLFGVLEGGTAVGSRYVQRNSHWILVLQHARSIRTSSLTQTFTLSLHCLSPSSTLEHGQWRSTGKRSESERGSFESMHALKDKTNPSLRPLFSNYLLVYGLVHLSVRGLPQPSLVVCYAWCCGRMLMKRIGFRRCRARRRLPLYLTDGTVVLSLLNQELCLPW